jgi:hypothetical protein
MCMSYVHLFGCINEYYKLCNKHNKLHIQFTIYHDEMTDTKSRHCWQKYYTAVNYECQMNGFLSGLFSDAVEN